MEIAPPRELVAKAVYELTSSNANQRGTLSTIQAQLLPHPKLVEEFSSQLLDLAGSGSTETLSVVNDIFSAASKSEPNAEVLAISLRAASSQLSRKVSQSGAVELIGDVLAAAFQESKLLFPDQQLWEAFHEAMDAVVEGAESASTSVRLRAVQLVQLALQLLTSPAASRLGKPVAQVAAQIQKYLRHLLACLRAAKLGGQSSVLTIAAARATLALTASRPGQAGRLLPSLLALTAPDALPPHGRASVRKCLTGGLLDVLAAADAPALRAWRPKIVDALRNLGVDVQSPSQPSQQQGNRRGGFEQTPPSTPEMEPSETAHPSHASHEAGQTAAQGVTPPDWAPDNLAPLAPPPPPPPRQQQQPITTAPQDPRRALQGQQSAPLQPQGLADAAGSSGSEGEGASEAEISQVIAIAAALLAENDQATCFAFVNGLPAAVLADVVLAGMANLPAREDVASSEARDTPTGNVLLAGLMQATAAPAASPSAGQASAPIVVPAAADEKAPGVQTTSKPPIQKPAPVIRLQPLQLSHKDAADCARAALRRVLASKAAPCAQLRTSILARLSPAMQDEAWCRAMAEAALERWRDGGCELALKWLSAVFAATVRESGQAPTDTGDSSERTESSREASTSQQTRAEPSEEYVRCLRTMLKTCREKAPAKERALAQLLVEAPVLPDGVLNDALGELVAEGGEAATLALISARDVALHRPGNRACALRAMLQMAVSADAELRAKAVRLVANKLFSNIALTADIETFAIAELRSLRRTATGSKRSREAPSASGSDEIAATSKRQRGDEKNLGPSVAESMSDHAQGPPGELAIAQGAGHENGPEDVDEATNRPDVANDHGRKRKARQGDAETESAQRDAKRPAGAAMPGDAPVDNGDIGSAEESPGDAARSCELYCALCTKRHALLRELFAVFGDARPAGRAAILSNADGLARVLGAVAPALIAIVDDVPLGAESLLLKMLYFLTEAQPPPQVLVDACQRNFERTHDPSILPPALGGLPKDRIAAFLPQVLDPTSLFSVALARILQPRSSGGMTPTDVLLALHSIDPAAAGVRLKQVIGALDVCVAQRDVFDRAVLASTLQQLNQRAALPPLYMRFLMQSQAAAPDLRGFVIEQLAALVNRQIWTNRTLFTGWNLAVRQNAPESFPAFLQLPSRVLTETLQAAPEDFQLKLKEYAVSPACPANQQRPIMRLLEAVGK